MRSDNPDDRDALASRHFHRLNYLPQAAHGALHAEHRIRQAEVILQAVARELYQCIVLDWAQTNCVPPLIQGQAAWAVGRARQAAGGARGGGAAVVQRWCSGGRQAAGGRRPAPRALLQSLAVYGARQDAALKPKTLPAHLHIDHEQCRLHTVALRLEGSEGLGAAHVEPVDKRLRRSEMCERLRCCRRQLSYRQRRPRLTPQLQLFSVILQVECTASMEWNCQALDHG